MNLNDPTIRHAYAFIGGMPPHDQQEWIETFEGLAEEGDVTANGFRRTLVNLLGGENVEDLDLLRLAWFLRSVFEVPQLEHLRMLNALTLAARDAVNSYGSGDDKNAVQALHAPLVAAEAMLKQWEDVL